MRRIVIAVVITAAFLTAASRATPTADAVVDPMPGCDVMDVGPVYDASLEATTTLACFQLAIPAVAVGAKLDVNFAGFDAGTPHDVSLVRVHFDGSTQVVASDNSANSHRIVQATNVASTRWLVLVGRPDAGTDSPFQMQATLAYGSDWYESNDLIAKANVLRGNQFIEANLDSAVDVDHYLVALRTDQAQTIVEFSAAGSVVAEIIDGANQPRALQTGKPFRADSSRPIFISVRGTASAEAGAPYTLRTRDPKAFAVISKLYSAERISHLAPGKEFPVPGGANAARTIEVEATIFEGDGTTHVGSGHQVVFSSFDREDPSRPNPRWPLASKQSVTNDKGVARATLNIGPCRGGARGPVHVQTRANPPEFWDITYNPASAVVATVPGGDAAAEAVAIKGVGPFQHVCKEVFRGRRP